MPASCVGGRRRASAGVILRPIDRLANNMRGVTVPAFVSLFCSVGALESTPRQKRDNTIGLLFDRRSGASAVLFGVRLFGYNLSTIFCFVGFFAVPDVMVVFFDKIKPKSFPVFPVVNKENTLVSSKTVTFIIAVILVVCSDVRNFV